MSTMPALDRMTMRDFLTAPDSPLFADLTPEILDWHVNGDGDRIARLAPLSNAHMPLATIDTYATFNGDSWLDGECQYLADDVRAWLDYPLNGHVEWEPEYGRDFDVTYDHGDIVRALAEESAAIVTDMADWIVSAEAVSVSSPAYYNFETDGYLAELTLNLNALADAMDAAPIGDGTVGDMVTHMHDAWRSRDGFISYVAGRIDADPIGYALIGYIQHLLSDESDAGDEYRYAMWENEYDVYTEHARVTITPEGYARLYEAITGHEYEGDDMENDDDLISALPPTQDETIPGLTA